MEDRSTGGNFSGSSGGSSSWQGVQESPPLPFPHSRHPDSSHDFYREDRFAGMHNQGFLGNTVTEGPGSVRDDVKSCFVVSAAFSFFVSMCMAFGLYGSETLKLGPNTSALINPNHLLVESIQVTQLDAGKGPMLYGFSKTPPLDIVVAWSEDHKITLPSDFHKEWVFYLNAGSQVSLNFTVEDSSSTLVLVIVEGIEGLDKWLEDPSNPNTAFSWTIIYGKGLIQKAISKSSTYYVAVGNLNAGVVKVDLNIGLEALLYNTTKAYYSCTPSNGQCNFKLLFISGNAAVLTSPSRTPGVLSGDWHVKVSYGPRWVTYLVGAGTLISLLVLINYFLNHFQRSGLHQSDQLGDNSSERNPLISHESDKHLSRSSSFNSVSEGEEPVEDSIAGDGKPVKEDDESRRLCAICFDAPKDCFYLPCGHCVSCFACATRVIEASGSCPVCRRRIKKVRKIITV